MLHNEMQMVTAGAIRDITERFSAVCDCKRSGNKTVVIHNGLNQSIDIKVQGCIDGNFNNVLEMEPLETIALSSDDYITISDYMPNVRVSYQCSTAPTTGTIDIYMVGVET